MTWGRLAIALAASFGCIAVCGWSVQSDPGSQDAEVVAPQTGPSAADSLLDEIGSNRKRGDYSEALEQARRRLTLIQAQQGFPEYELGEARRLVATLEKISRLDASARSELALADALDDSIAAAADGRPVQGSRYRTLAAVQLVGCTRTSTSGLRKAQPSMSRPAESTTWNRVPTPVDGSMVMKASCSKLPLLKP